MKITEQGILWQNGIRLSVPDYKKEGGDISKLPHWIDDIKTPSIIKPDENKELNDVKIGLGLYKWNYNPNIIKFAVCLGIKLIDTSPTYGFGRVNNHLANIKLDHSVIISNKIAKNRMSAKSIINAWGKYVSEFGLNKVLYQIHWPMNRSNLKDTVSGLNSIQRNLFGTPNYIGVCNCDLYLLQTYMKYVKIQSLQIPFNVWRGLDYDDTLNFCKKHNIKLLGYSPFGQNHRLLKADKRLWDGLGYFSKQINCTENQYLLAWIRSKGVTPIFASNDLNHIQENFESTKLELNEENEFNNFLKSNQDEN